MLTPDAATATVPVVNSATSFMTPDELAQVGFGAVGRAARISRLARLYEPAHIFLGDEVRIDDFAIVSPGAGEIIVGSFVHIAAASMLFGGVTIGDWSTLSSRVAVYGVSDDFRTDAVTYPHVTDQRAVVVEPVSIGDHVVVGTGSTVLPGANIGPGIAIGAMSLVTGPIERPGLYVGTPVRWLRYRTTG